MPVDTRSCVSARSVYVARERYVLLALAVLISQGAMLSVLDSDKRLADHFGGKVSPVVVTRDVTDNTSSTWDTRSCESCCQRLRRLGCPVDHLPLVDSRTAGHPLHQALRRSCPRLLCRPHLRPAMAHQAGHLGLQALVLVQRPHLTVPRRFHHSVVPGATCRRL